MAFKTKTQSLWALIALLATLIIVPTAYALVGQENLDRNLRGRGFCNQRFNDNDTGASSQTLGSGGTVASTTLNAVTSISLAEGAFAGAPYAARLYVDIDDSGTDQALECDSVVVTGYDQYGKWVRETYLVPNETAVLGNQVFSKVTSATAVGCTAGAEAGDVFLIYVSNFIGIGSRVRSWREIESACIIDATDSTSRCAIGDNGGANDLQSAFSTTFQTIDFSVATLFGNVTAAGPDEFCLRVRPAGP